MPVITDPIGYWDHYATGVQDETPEEALKNAFGWTQYDGHGPGDEILGNALRTMELGSGCGNAVAALATKGIDATGIDISPAQTTTARNRWRHLPNAHYLAGDVLDYLTGTDQQWDAMYSIWGALWFTDPHAILPAVRDRLTPSGKLVFSHAPAVPGSYGIQGMYGNGFTGRQTWIYRWAYEPDTWSDLLHQHGFVDVNARVESAPEPDNVGTLIVEARRPA
ncbi:SAM-dependent methyltransferase [Actinophytocola xinjiangensis]|uniref:SAM-dependent methyltransferase n=1 Tax=Actinophytocola xinjiangensis TaxID=485602 RepID=A0A7Z0WS57_9PSEU|nr:class I SAM-dependent methyltransferase [Actinophytocola xinjiangensis]OLF12932.1 SAM-dependent methyltransferase [Actinophytocola xinjiangensis]